MQTSDFFTRVPTPDAEAAARLHDEMVAHHLDLGGLGTLAANLAAMAARRTSRFRTHGSAQAGNPHLLSAYVQVFELDETPLISSFTSHPPQDFPQWLVDQPGVTITVAKASAATTVPGSGELTDEDVTAALTHARTLAEQARDSGADVIIPAVAGPGASTIGAILTGLATRTEPVKVTGSGLGHPISDAQWNDKVTVVRDGMFAARDLRTDPLAVLRQISQFVHSSHVLTVSAFIAYCAIESLPVLIDGPATAGATMWADRLAPGTHEYVMLATQSAEPSCGLVQGSLGLPVISPLTMRAAEGIPALSQLPLIRHSVQLIRYTRV